MAFDLVGPSPQGRTISRISKGVSFIISVGVFAFAKRIGVTSLTLLSVHWAERRVAISRV